LRTFGGDNGRLSVFGGKYTIGGPDFEPKPLFIPFTLFEGSRNEHLNVGVSEDQPHYV
jgi:hypothetical protein